jgi:Na+-driven multidrug efflux pump
MSTAAATPALDPRTRLLLEAPIAPTLLRLAMPNVLVMLAQAGVGLIETYFVGQLRVGRDSCKKPQKCT